MTLVALGHARGRATFGGKAAQLADALAAGLPVPSGYALALESVEAIAAGASVVGLPEGRWAVRSSAVDEDSHAASFAGQHLTRLNVPTRDVTEAVREVFASAHTASARAYREKMGLAGRARMAVVVQGMVRAHVAGVMFTKNPVSRAVEHVIEAAWGLGEAVVAGVVTPDSVRLALDGRILEHRVGHKDVEVRHLPDGGTEQVEVEPARASAPCLDGSRLERLHALAHQVTRAFGPAQDIEWAFDEVGALHLLQRRGMTT